MNHRYHFLIILSFAVVLSSPIFGSELEYTASKKKSAGLTESHILILPTSQGLSPQIEDDSHLSALYTPYILHSHGSDEAEPEVEELWPLTESTSVQYASAGALLASTFSPTLLSKTAIFPTLRLKSPITTGLWITTAAVSLAVWHHLRYRHHDLGHALLSSSSSSQPQNNDAPLHQSQDGDTFLDHTPGPQNPPKFSFPLRSDDQWDEEILQRLWSPDLDQREYYMALKKTLETMQENDSSLQTMLMIYEDDFSRIKDPTASQKMHAVRTQLYTNLSYLQNNIHQLEEHIQQGELLQPGQLNAFLMHGWLAENYFKIMLADTDHIYPHLNLKHIVIGLRALPEVTNFRTEETQHTLAQNYFQLAISGAMMAWENESHRLQGQDDDSSGISISKEISKVQKIRKKNEKLAKTIEKNMEAFQSFPTIQDLHRQGKEPPYYQTFLDNHRKRVLDSHQNYLNLKKKLISGLESYQATKIHHDVVQQSLETYLELPQLISETSLLLRTIPPEI